ncbi:CbiX/SirB N-terminal domain-containing protein [Ramlibacter sp. 2FC]|uniref:sirohydrochlorin chelatase n=1 Tax=Ramlibacter sp. 2FC TaxID=2502188 RepID=UPI0010F8675D|nr:CbiX/SirB N-terminal domain-containing protein [Ramlibacter sp. 2FC]
MADAQPATGHGIVLFAHGSRDPLWRLPIEAVARRMLELAPQVPVRCAYLELSAPDLETAVGELLAQPLEQITVVPMFLGVGRHAREDLPLLMEALRARHPGVRFRLQGAIGEDARLTDMMARIALS